MIIADSTSAVRIHSQNVTGIDLDEFTGTVTIHSSVGNEELEIIPDLPASGPGLYMALVRAVAQDKPLCDIRKFK